MHQAIDQLILAGESQTLELKATLFEAIDQAMKFIVSYISVAFEFDGSLQRKERFAYGNCTAYPLHFEQEMH